MFDRSLLRIPFYICTIISFLFIVYYYLKAPYRTPQRHIEYTSQKTLLIHDETEGFILSSLYNELNSYITIRNNTTNHIKKTLIIQDKTVKALPLNYDYITLIKDDSPKNYPYSSWKCSNTSVTDYNEGSENCILTNIYYQSSTNEYYFYQNPNESNKRDTFLSSFGSFKLQIINDSKKIESLNVSSILTRPLLITHPPDANYAHGFLEVGGPRFWVLAECQSHLSYIDPTKIQIFYSSKLFDDYPHNWQYYQQQPDKTYLPTRKWEYLTQSMSSIYPLLTHRSFNETTVLFKYSLLISSLRARTAVWNHYYENRPFNSYPYPTVTYRRAYLAYSEWILHNFNLKSKFQLSLIQQEIQENKIREQIPICDQTCSIQQSTSRSNEYSGDWIVVLNRAGSGRREILNADELVDGLLKTFPDHSNPYLRVWPKQLNFDDDLYKTARLARSIRLLIGVHGAGLSNTLFMRPGTILYEINSAGCRHLSFNFRRWAEVFNLQHALWIPTTGNNAAPDSGCNRDGSVRVNVKEMIDEVKNLIRNEIEYRNGYIKRALLIMNDTSLVDHLPPGFKNILYR